MCGGGIWKRKKGRGGYLLSTAQTIARTASEKTPVRINLRFRGRRAFQTSGMGISTSRMSEETLKAICKMEYWW